MGLGDQLLGCQMPSAHGFLGQGYLGQQQASFEQILRQQEYARGLGGPYDNSGRLGFLDREKAKELLEEPPDSKPKDELTEYDEFEQLCNHKFHDLLTKFNQLKEEIE